MDAPVEASSARPLISGMRAMFVVSCVTVSVSGFQLFVLTEHTDRFFAWTIDVPLTAAFLGASYWGSFALVLVASRQQAWAWARVALPGVWLFTVLTLVATLIHIDLFRMDSVFGWAWVSSLLGCASGLRRVLGTSASHCRRRPPLAKHLFTDVVAVRPRCPSRNNACLGDGALFGAADNGRAVAVGANAPDGPSSRGLAHRSGPHRSPYVLGERLRARLRGDGRLCCVRCTPAARAGTLCW